jgi:hypothetical protein
VPARNFRQQRRRIQPVCTVSATTSADRTLSPPPVSRKREYSRWCLETFGEFGLALANLRVQRLGIESQKPAIGGPFCRCQRLLLRAPDYVAGDPAMRNQISNSNSLLTGNFTGNFAYLACERLSPMRETPVLQSLLGAIPYQTYQGK